MNLHDDQHSATPNTQEIVSRENLAIDQSTAQRVDRQLPIPELITAIREKFETLLTLPPDLKWEQGIESLLGDTRFLLGQNLTALDSRIVLEELATHFDLSDIRRAYGQLYQRQEDHLFETIRDHSTLRSFLESTEYLSDMLELGIREFEAAAVSSGDRILFIGGGSIPITPLGFILLDRAVQDGSYSTLATLAKNRDTFPQAIEMIRGLVDASHITPSIQLTCIDRDANMVMRGTNFVEHFGIQGIHITNESGESVAGSVSPFAAAIFAATISPKADVLRHLAESGIMQEDAAYVLRLKPEDSLGALVYEPLTGTALQELSDNGLPFELCLSVPPAEKPAIFSTTQVLRKRISA